MLLKRWLQKRIDGLTDEILGFIIIAIAGTSVAWFVANPEWAWRITILFLLLVLFILVLLILNRLPERRKFPHLPDDIGSDLLFGLQHIDNVIIPQYLEKSKISLIEKKDAMSDVLRRISLTTVPTTLENLARIGLFEVRSNGRFRILAAHHIDAHRIPKLERTFSHDPHNPVGMVGYAVVERRTILVPDLRNHSDPHYGKWQKTEENNLPGQSAESILCVPVFDTHPTTSSSNCLAVISISCSKRNSLDTEHQRAIEMYADRVRTLLLHLNKQILFDPEMTPSFRAITVSGEAGAGKTALVTELAAILKATGWRVISIGEELSRFRAERGFAPTRVNQLPDDVHILFDEHQKIILREEEQIIIEGRLSGYLAEDIPDVLTIYCDLPFSDRVQRFAKRENIGNEEAQSIVSETDRMEIERYKRLYGVDDYRDRKYYKLYLSTDELPGDLATRVIRAMERIS